MQNKILFFLIIFSFTVLEAASIIGVSLPVNSMDATCTPLDSGVWNSEPLNINNGIGYWVNPSLSGGFVMHDHVYVSSYAPDPTRSVITYKFDTAVVVSQVQIYQHTRGISQIEGKVGNSLASLTSIGSTFSNRGDVTGWTVFSEWESTTFSFASNTLAGTYFQMVVKKTTWTDGYAAYRGFLTFTQAVPEIGTFYSVGFSAIIAVGYFLRRKYCL